MATPLHYYRTAERPDLRFWLTDGIPTATLPKGTLVDLSAHTLVFKLGQPGATATFTKSTGVTGAAGSGVEATGTPNCTVSFTAAELDSLTIGSTTWQIKATTGGLDRYWQGPFTVSDVIL